MTDLLKRVESLQRTRFPHLRELILDRYKTIKEGGVKYVLFTGTVGGEIYRLLLPKSDLQKKLAS